MAKASRTISLVEEERSENVIFEKWTQTWGLKVYPWYNADKLKFSFIEKGAEGAGKSFDIYMDTYKDDSPCFDDWAFDILHDFRFERNMANEAKEGKIFPEHYTFVTGENAEKNLGIMNSKNGGYCINASDGSKDENGKKIYANIPISFHGLRKLAETHTRQYQKRKLYLDDMREKAEKKYQETRMENQSSQNKPENVIPLSVANGTFQIKKFRCMKDGNLWAEICSQDGKIHLLLIKEAIVATLSEEMKNSLQQEKYRFHMKYVERTIQNQKVLDCVGF